MNSAKTGKVGIGITNPQPYCTCAPGRAGDSGDTGNRTVYANASRVLKTVNVLPGIAIYVTSATAKMTVLCVPSQQDKYLLLKTVFRVG